MVISDGESEFQLIAEDVEPRTSMRPGDLRARVRVSTRGFSGTNPEVWIAADEFERFVEGARLLERERRGEAKLTSMTPEDLCLSLRVRDQAGHVTVSGWVGRIPYASSGELVTARVGFSLDVDPTRLPGIVADLESLVVAR